MEMATGRQIMQEVAKEIRADFNYDGNCWVDEDTKCGCAMYRTMNRLGYTAKFSSSLIDLSNDKGEVVAPYEYEDVLASKTDIPIEEWQVFKVFSCTADNEKTAEVLEFMAEHGTFPEEHKGSSDDDDEEAVNPRYFTGVVEDGGFEEEGSDEEGSEDFDSYDPAEEAFHVEPESDDDEESRD